DFVVDLDDLRETVPTETAFQDFVGAHVPGKADSGELDARRGYVVEHILGIRRRGWRCPRRRRLDAVPIHIFAVELHGGVQLVVNLDSKRIGGGRGRGTEDQEIADATGVENEKLKQIFACRAGAQSRRRNRGASIGHVILVQYVVLLGGK